ncbi:MAG: cysteine-rich CWC family protein [Mariniphaga sp.]
MYSKYEPKECARCSKVHICTGTIRCPCLELEIPENILDDIAAQFDECLCNECMAEMKITNGV